MDQSDLPMETYLAALNELPDVRHLEIQGEGEPLAHPKFFDMVREANARGIRVSTITNGSFFSIARIEQILDCRMESIMVSIESPREDEFQSIRGGKLPKVIRGLKALLAARNKQNREQPVVGFTVTVMKQNRHRLKEIIELYEKLGMDGGVLLQMLNPMPAYSNCYPDAIKDQFIPRLEQVLLLSGFEKLCNANSNLNPVRSHFWHEFHNTNSSGSAAQEKHCPWLLEGLYINRHGSITPCPFSKDEGMDGFGKIGAVSIADIQVKKSEMSSLLETGEVPASCNHCQVADSVIASNRRRVPA